MDTASSLLVYYNSPPILTYPYLHSSPPYPSPLPALYNPPLFKEHVQMTITKLLDGVSSSTTSGSHYFNAAYGTNERGLLQVEISDTATVQLKGRLSSDASFVNIGDPITTSGFLRFELVREIQVEVTSYTSGTVDVWVQE